MASDNGPWNIGGPGPRPPAGNGGGPWGGLGGGQGGGGRPGQGPLPDLDQLVLRFVAWLRRLGGDGGGRGLALLGIAAVSLWLLTGFYRVQPDELGVVLRFGAYVRTTPPGLNYHLPWPVEEVLLPAVTRINRIEIGFRTAPAEGPEQNARTPDGETEPARGQPPRELSEESLMLTGDENIIDINFAVFWRIRDAVPYLFNTRNPGYTVKSAAESVMREVIGRTPIQSALTQGRASIEQAVLTGAQAILDQYGAGVEITQVQLQKVDPPAEVIESFRDVQRANTDADRARNEAQAYANDIVPRARGDAAGILGAAQGDRQATIARATGEAQRFLSVYAAYTRAKDVTLRRLYIETMQEILQHTPTVVVDDRLRSILPTLRLGPEAAPSAAPATGKGGGQ